MCETTTIIPYRKTRRVFLRFKEKNPKLSIDLVVDHLVLCGHNPDVIKDVIREYYGLTYAELREHCNVLTPAV